MKKVSAVLWFCLFNFPAYAWDGAVTDRISAIEVTEGTNYGLRIFLANGAAQCTGGPVWSYLNETDSNYKTFTAALIAAKMSGSTVTLYTTRNTSGYCHIGYITVH